MHAIIRIDDNEKMIFCHMLLSILVIYVSLNIVCVCIKLLLKNERDEIKQQNKVC